jgi:hypothetical protein
VNPNPGPIDHKARLRRPYFRIGAVVALAMGVVALGYFGPHQTPRATPSLGPTPIAQSRTVAPPAPASPFVQPPPSVRGGLEGATGLTRVPSYLVLMTASALPGQTTSRSFGLIGSRLFYVVANERIESSVIGSPGDPQTIVTVSGCQAISELAAHGDSLVYLVTSPEGAAAKIDGCGTSSRVGWTLWLLDLRGGSPRMLAQGVRDAADFGGAVSPSHVALSDAAYAFDRPTVSNDPSRGETVEVHSIDGALLWATSVGAPVRRVMLGGGRLAVLTQGPGTGRTARTLWLSDAAHPVPAEVASPASSASLSSDGSYLTWDLTLVAGLSSASRQLDIEVEDTTSGRPTFLAAPITAGFLGATHPTVSATGGGAVVAWLATAPSGSVYPAFTFTADGSAGFLDTDVQPVWLESQGSSLTWVTESPDGSVFTVFEADLSTIARLVS